MTNSKNWGFIFHCGNCGKKWFAPEPSNSSTCEKKSGGCGKPMNPNELRGNQ